MDKEIKQNIPVKTTLPEDINMDALRLDRAWEWLYESCKTAPADTYISDLLHRWPACRETFLRQFRSGDYRLSYMSVGGFGQQTMWSAEYALELKWVTLAITEDLHLHEKRGYFKGHSGGKSAIQRVSQSINVSQLNGYLASQGFQKHPDKTYIGKVSKGFELLGAWLMDKGITDVAPRALANHLEKVRQPYEQTRHWSETMRSKGASYHCSLWKIWAIMFCLAPSMATSATNVMLGTTYRQNISVTLPARTSSSTKIYSANAGASPAALSPVSDTYGCYRSGGLDKPAVGGTTSDGYEGLLLATDVVVGFSGTLQGRFHSVVNGFRDATMTLDDRGRTSSSSPPLSYPWYWCAPSDVGDQYTPDSNNGPSTFSGSIFIHAGPLAEPDKTYSVPLMYFNRWRGLNEPGDQALLPTPTSVTVTSAIDCSISVQDPVVNFNQTQQNSVNGTVLAQYASSLNVSCSQSGAVPMTITANGTRGRYTDTLALAGSEGQGNLAEVRGSLVTNPVSPCNNQAERIFFNGTAVSIGNVASGQTTLPLTWTLCSNGSGLKGTGQAQATINLNWP